MAERDQSIDTLRGATILAVAAFHSVNPALDPTAASPLGYLRNFVDPVIMPVFAALSGFMYARRPVQTGRLAGFVRERARRLLVPYLVTVTLFVVLRRVTSDATAAPLWPELWRGYFTSYNYLWFLQALFGVSVMVACMDIGQWLARPFRWALALLLAGFLAFTAPGSDWFSIWGVWYLLPHFLLGYGARRHAHWALHPVSLALAAVGLLGGYLCMHLSWFGVLELPHTRRSPSGMVAGAGAILLLLKYRPSLRPLAALGLYSYAVYLFHGFGLEAGERLAGSLQLPDPGRFLLLVACGVAFALLMQTALDRSVPGRLALGLPARTNRAKG